MSWIVTLKIVDCASMSTLLPGAQISSPLLNPPGYVVSDANGQAQIYDAYDVWEWVNLTITKSGTGGPCDANYDPGYTAKNFVINMSMDGTIQTVCLNKAPAAVCDPNAPAPNCFIVSAATGSTMSFEVTELRALRDRVSAKSRLGAGLIEAIYSEYESFSPPIAAELHEDAAMRGLVLNYIVRPLFAWYRLAGTLALDLENQSAQRQAAQLAVAEACPADALADAEMIVGLLEALRGSAPLPAELPPLLRGLVPRIAELHFAPWAILDPLIRTWRAASEGRDVTSDVADWLAAAPLERLPQPSDHENLRTEFALIASFLAFAPDRRGTLGDRLRTAWPDTEESLVRAGLTRQTESL